MARRPPPLCLCAAHPRTSPPPGAWFVSWARATGHSSSGWRRARAPGGRRTRGKLGEARGDRGDCVGSVSPPRWVAGPLGLRDNSLALWPSLLNSGILAHLSFLTALDFILCLRVWGWVLGDIPRMHNVSRLARLVGAFFDFFCVVCVGTPIICFSCFSLWRFYLCPLSPLHCRKVE